MLPLSIRQKDKLIDQFGSLESACENNEAFKAIRAMFPIKTDAKSKKKFATTKLKLLLSAQQMVVENYPLPLSGKLGDKYQEFQFTKSEYAEVCDDSPLYSVDCEMCLTDAGHELTRHKSIFCNIMEGGGNSTGSILY